MSGSGGIDDPFGWSNERLVQELCGARLPKKWPDPAVLAEKLREHELDGSDLLSYEDQMGPGGFDSLCSDLGFTKIPHKASLHVAIRVFQKRSPEYQAWKTLQTASDSQPQPDDEDDKNDENPEKPLNKDVPLPQQPQAEASSERGAATRNGHAENRPSQAAPSVVIAANGASKSTEAANGAGSANGTTSGATNGHTNAPSATTNDHTHGHPEPMDIDTPAQAPSMPVEQQRKRKRLIPTNISSTPTRPLDAFGGPLAGNADQLWQNSADGAYLGDWAVTKYALLQPSDPLDPASGYDDASDNFGWARPLPIPAGRRLQVGHAVRRYLQPTRASMAKLGRTPRAPTANTLGVVAALPDDEDEVLPALGESDDEGYDTETWEEMEQEANERAAQKKRKNAPLPVEIFDSVIADAIRGIETKWSAKKLPKLRRREHRLWTAARRAGSRKLLLSKALKEADRFERRIGKLVQEMRACEWRNENEIRVQAALLDANIEDRQHALWESRLYSLPAAPPKPVVDGDTRRAAAPRVPPAKLINEDEEILTSSSSEDNGDGLQDFVVQGEEEDDLATLSDGPMDISDDDQGEPMDVVKSADKPGSAQPKRPSAGPPVVLPAPPAADFPLEDLAAIAKKGVSFWETAGDVMRLLCTIFSSADGEQLARLFVVLSQNVDDLWQKFCVPVMEGDGAVGMSRTEDDATAFTRYFYIFLTVQDVAPRDFLPREEAVRKRIVDGRIALGSFCVKMRMIAPYFAHLRAPIQMASQAATSAKTTPPEPSRATKVVDLDSADDDDEDDLYLTEVRAVTPVEEKEDSDDADVQLTPSFRRRGRLVARDQGAQSLRDRDKARQAEQETRRKVLYESLAQTGQLLGEQARLIINEAKDKHHGLVYVHSWIARSIRDHQVRGVRFMWNTLIAPPDARQGCLLAHTMGLGKTMQVITLLVAIAEAAQSADPTVSAQIPEDLRESRTLILCPPGLVLNWADELLKWAPPATLGANFQITASMRPDERLDELQRWAQQGGTLVLGYRMLAALAADFGRAATELLEKTPNIVVADEAHMLKNPTSQVHALTKHFRTSARIAMTGSPLANSVSEYHSMIDWVAPNYLAARDEFNAMYANPIKEGFYRDSTPTQRRHAYKMLKVLKDTVAPKIQRVTVSSLAGVLPPKHEVILYVPLTPLQLAAYAVFIRCIKQPAMMDEISTTVQLWNLLINLTLLLAHPRIFRERLLEMKEARAHPGGRARGSGRTATLPSKMVDELLATVGARDLDSVEHSNKMVVLTRILDEARRAGEKVLVFTQSKLVLDYLETVFVRQKRLFQRLDGDTAVARRQDMTKQFNAGNDEVYLISTTAGGVGLNIQGANRVVIFDFKWNPMHEQQAIGRAYRIGQTRPVFVYWLIVGETFETVLHDQAVFKTQLVSRVVDKKNPSAWADQIKNYTREPAVLAADDPDVLRRVHGNRDRVLDALLDANAPGICKIVSTDTFEQEEPEDKLSAEELTEASRLVQQNQDRFKIAKDGPAGQAGQMRRVPTASTVPTVAVPPVQHMQVDGAGFAPDSFRPRPTVTPLAVPESLVLPSQLLRTTIPAPPVYPTVVSSGVVPPPMQIRTQNADHSVDSGVNFHGSFTGDDPLFLDPVPETPEQPSLDVTSTSLASTPDELTHLLRTALLSGGIPWQRPLNTRDADMLARKAVMDIERTFQLAGVPARAQWGRLKALVTAHPQLIEVIVYGAVAPSRLSSMTASEEAQFVAVASTALDELAAHTLDGVFSETATPSACALFGVLDTLERVLERKLFEGATLSPRATGSPLAGTLARDAGKDIAAATPDDRRVAVYTSYALRIFRDPVFAAAVVAREFDFYEWGRCHAQGQADIVRRLHARHQKAKPNNTNNSPSVHLRAAKSEPDDGPARTLHSVPSRPHSIAARNRDPDHVKHHLNRSQNRRPSGQDISSTAPATPTPGEGARRALGPRTASADLLAMREVMERRERKSSGPGPSGPSAPSGPSTPVAAPRVAAPRVAAPRPAPAPAPMSLPTSQPYTHRAPVHAPPAPVAAPVAPPVRIPLPATAQAPIRTPISTPLLVPAHHALQAQPQPMRFSGPPRDNIPPHKLRAELERSLLEADRLQQAKKQGQATTSGHKPKPGDNARNPFVLDD